MKKRVESDCESLLIQNNIGNQIFTKTINLKRSGGFDVALKAWQDIECWYRLLKTFNQVAVYSGCNTYVADQSHSHERISDNKKDVIDQAYAFFCQKHHLSKDQKLKLSLHKIQYGITKNMPKTYLSLLLAKSSAGDRGLIMYYAVIAMLVSIKQFLKKGL